MGGLTLKQFTGGGVPSNKSAADPAGLKKSKPKKPEKTAEELAIERRTRSLLDKEIGDEEEKLRSMTRGRKGSASLLGKAAATRKASASGKSSSKRTVGYNSGTRGYGGGTGNKSIKTSSGIR